MTTVLSHYNYDSVVTVPDSFSLYYLNINNLTFFIQTVRIFGLFEMNGRGAPGGVVLYKDSLVSAVRSFVSSSTHLTFTAGLLDQEVPFSPLSPFYSHGTAVCQWQPYKNILHGLSATPASAPLIRSSALLSCLFYHHLSSSFCHLVPGQ